MLRAASARTGRRVSKIKYWTVRPEHNRRAPIDFSHGLNLEMARQMIHDLEPLK